MQSFNAPISNVIVYKDRARIQRMASLKLVAGEQSILITGLSRKMNLETLAVSIPAAQIVSITPSPQYTLSLSEAEISALSTELKEAENFAQNLRIERSLLEQEFHQLKVLAETVSGHLGLAIINGTKSFEDATALRAGLLASFRNAEIQKRQYEEQETVVKAQIEQLKKRLSNNSRYILHYDVEIKLRVKKARNVEVLLSYFVSDAAWQAQYHLELQAEHVHLDYAVTISQNTGEDWPKLILTLSTADFSQKPEIPRAKYWEIDKLDPSAINNEIRNRQSRLLEENIGTRFSGQHSVIHKRLPVKEIEEQATREIEAEEEAKLQAAMHGTASIESFQTNEAVSVAANNEIVHTRIASLKLPAVFDFATVPKVSAQVIHRAKIINSSGFTLVPAPVLIQDGGLVLSRTEMNRTAPNEEIEFPLRIEEHIKIRRRLAERSVMLMNDNLRRIHYRFVISIENYRNENCVLTLRDTMPVSLSEEVQVRFLEANPPLNEMGERGILKWVLELSPNSKSSVEFSFEIDSSKTIYLSGIL